MFFVYAFSLNLTNSAACWWVIKNGLQCPNISMVFPCTHPSGFSVALCSLPGPVVLALVKRNLPSQL